MNNNKSAEMGRRIINITIDSFPLLTSFLIALLGHAQKDTESMSFIRAQVKVSGKCCEIQIWSSATLVKRAVFFVLIFYFL